MELRATPPLPPGKAAPSAAAPASPWAASVMTTAVRVALRVAACPVVLQVQEVVAQRRHRELRPLPSQLPPRDIRLSDTSAALAAATDRYAAHGMQEGTLEQPRQIAAAARRRPAVSPPSVATCPAHPLRHSCTPAVRTGGADADSEPGALSLLHLPSVL